MYSGVLRCTQVPTHGVEVFALDTTAWPRPCAPTLSDRHYVHSSGSGIGGSPTVVGYCYSLLSWVASKASKASKRSSWALPVNTERVSSSVNPLQVGIAQVKRLCEVRGGFDVIVADGGYGNHQFLHS